MNVILVGHQTQSPPQSPRPGTGHPTPSDTEPWLNVRRPVRTTGGEPRQPNPVPGMLAYRPPPPYIPHVIPMPFLMQIPPVPPKRPNDEEEESFSTPRKKTRTSRAKADGSAGKCLDISGRRTSSSDVHPVPKRGYTAKKRNEAAQIAAQNGQSHSVPKVNPLTIAIT